MNEESEENEIDVNDPFNEPSTTRQAKEAWNIMLNIINREQTPKEE